jgi:hypothetical protein
MSNFLKRNTIARILVLTLAVCAVSLGLAGDQRPIRDGSERMAYLDKALIS